jgi:hypothetical protein
MIGPISPYSLWWGVVLLILVIVGGAGAAGLVMGDQLPGWVMRVFSTVFGNNTENNSKKTPISLKDIQNSDVKLELHHHHHYSDKERDADE